MCTLIAYRGFESHSLRHLHSSWQGPGDGRAQLPIDRRRARSLGRTGRCGPGRLPAHPVDDGRAGGGRRGRCAGQAVSGRDAGRVAVGARGDRPDRAHPGR